MVPGAATASGRTQQLTTPEQVPDGLQKSDWSSIRAAYDAGRHAFHATKSGYHARNPGQQWLTTFDQRGFIAQPQNASWTWGLELHSYGFGDQQQRIGGKPAMQAAGQRLSYQWDSNVQEWWVNDQRGLEHGFTVAQRPAVDAQSAAGNAPLSFTLNTRGGLQPQVLPGALGVAFRNAAGATVLNYSGLKVWDADGKILAARFEPAGTQQLRLSVDERGARYPLTIDPIAQQAYLKASNTGANDQFGWSVAVAGDTVVVGARLEDSAATGVNGDQASNAANNAGAAYVYTRSAGVWTQQAYLKASNTGTDDQFGYSVAVAGDTVVVGAFGEASDATGVNGDQASNAAFNAGAAYVYTRSAGVWTQQAYLKASNTEAADNFGFSVAVAGDTVVVGAPSEDSDATGVNSAQASNAASQAGAAYVYTRSAGVWTQQAYLKASNTGVGDRFGTSVAVAGDTVVVGAYFEDSAATGINGDQASNAAGNAGAAYVYTRSAGVWTQQAYLKASNTGAGDEFGYSVAVSGDTVVVGAIFEDSATTGVNGDQASNAASNAGAAYVYTRSAGVWTQQAYLKASNTGASDFFGYSVAVAGDTVVIGAVLEDSAATGVNGDQASNAATDAGAAYVYTRSAGVWTQQAYLKASNTGVGDQFGFTVAVAGDTVVVGALVEDSAATGVNGDQASNAASAAGAAYVFLIGDPEINLTGNSLSITDGDSTPDASDHTDFGNVDVASGTLVRTFTVQNTGTANLAVSSIALSGAQAADFTLGALSPASPIAPGASATFTVSFDPSAAGLRTATITVNNDDSDEAVYDFAIAGTGTVSTPTVTAITPNTGITPGGTNVTITGTGFTGATAVNIGGVAATAVNVVSATSITAVTGARAVGAVSVDVTTPGGTNAANTLYTYRVPVPGDVDPLNLNIGGFNVLASAVQPDGKTIIAGSFSSVLGQTRNNIARLNADGTLDAGFNPNANDEVYSVALQADGQILLGGIFTTIAGSPRNRIARVAADGTLDAGFDPNANGFVFSIAVQADRQILLGGSFDTVGGSTRSGIARVAANGTLDAGFNPNANSAVRSIALQADGQILLGGAFTNIGGSTRNRIARVAANGTADAGFNPDANGGVFSIAVQSDGQILLGGAFTTVGGSTRNRIARVAANGTLDTGFNPNANIFVESIAVQADGQILLGGQFTSVDGTARNRIARVAANGTLDASFNPNANRIVRSIASQADGQILLGGNFDTIGGSTRNAFARLLNDPATQSLDATDATQVLWTRGGSAPDVSQTTFELSTNGGVSYTPLGGTATRVGSTANWQLSGLSLPASGQLRARGRTAGGYFNGSAGIVEQVAVFSGLLFPEIAVSGNSVDIADGDSTPSAADHSDFGAVNLGGTPLVRTFTISNTGTGPLTLGNATLSGANAADFSVTVQPNTPVAASASTTMQVTFSPSALGVRSASVSFSNDDANENPFDFAIAGTGANAPPTYTPAPAITRQQGSAASFAILGVVSDLTDPASALTVAVVPGGTATGVSATNLFNTNGSVTANIEASCTAVSGTVRLAVTDLNSLTGTGDFQVNVTPNTPPTLGYAAINVGVGASATQNPAGLNDNGGRPTVSILSQGTYTGTISAGSNGALNLSNAAPAGTHSVTVRATDNCSSNTDVVLQVNVAQAGTIKQITSNVQPSRFGEAVTLSVQVAGVNPTGTVEFFNGAASLGSAPLVASPSGGANLKLANLVLSNLAVGSLNLTARYAGDVNNAASISDVLVQTVLGSDTRITLTPAVNPAAIGASTINVVVQASAPGGGVPAGSVTISAGTASCVAPLTAGAGSCALNFASVGLKALSATYTPSNANHLASTGGGGLVVVATPSSTDLRVRIGNGTSNIGAGQNISYLIVVDNLGSQAAVGRLEVPISSDLTGASYTCISAALASCGASGTGNIDQELSLAPGGVVIYRLQVTAPLAPERVLTQTASITAKAPTTDTDATNNTAADIDPMGLLADGYEDAVVTE